MVFFVIMHYLCKIILYPFMYVLYPLKIVDKHNMPKNKSLIVVCNHLSWVDILQLWVRLKGWRRFVAKKEVGKGLFKPFVMATGTVFVGRDGRDFRTVKRCIDILKKGQGINLFPEGTRNKTNEELQPLEKGASMFAIRSGATIVPTIILHKSKLFKKNYIRIGEPFKLDEYGGVISKDNLDNGNDKIFNAMKSVQNGLRLYV